MPRLFLSALLAVISLPVAAQPVPAQYLVDNIPASRRPSIELGSGPGQEQWQASMDQVSVRNVTGAALYPVLPRAGYGNGKAVIVAPGGGYLFLSIESEGFRVAEALAASGYTAFVLKYRTTPSPREIPAFLAATGKIFGNLGKGPSTEYPPAVEDMASAVSHVRSHAGDWGLDPAHVGVIGFSAGARTAIRFLETSPEAAKIDSVALLYPPMVETVKPGPRPPLFLAVAVDDPLFRQGGLGLLQHWLGESPKVEAHFYSGGSHGFGMRLNGNTSDDWIAQYIDWLDRR